MKLSIITSTEKEIQPLIKKIKANNTSLAKKLNIVVTGVGLTATAYQLTKHIHTDKPDFIIQAGVAGSLDKSLAIGDVVLIQDEYFGDLGVIENKNFHDVFHLKLEQPNKSPFTKGRLVNKNPLLAKSNLNKVSGVTVQEITTSRKMIEYFIMDLRASVESMEGAACHYVCLQENIPFLQIRGISNYVGERNKEKWDFKESIKNMNNELEKLLLEI